MNNLHVKQRKQLNGFRWIDPEPDIEKESIGSVLALEIKFQQKSLDSETSMET